MTGYFGDFEFGLCGFGEALIDPGSLGISYPLEAKFINPVRTSTTTKVVRTLYLSPRINTIGTSTTTNVVRTLYLSPRINTIGIIRTR